MSIVDTDEYRVTVNSFLSDGGAVDLDALVTYLGANSPVAPGPQDRISQLTLVFRVFRGAQTESRTRDLRITNALLYQLSYLGSSPPRFRKGRHEYIGAGPRLLAGSAVTR